MRSASIGDDGGVITFDDDLRSTIERNLAAHDRLELSLDGRRHASVAVLLVDSEVGSDAVDPHPADADGMAKIPMAGDGQGKTGPVALPGDLDGHMNDVAGGAAFVLCRRAARLSTHSAQWALPGGRIDAGESVAQAALRETDEEIGVRLDEVSVLGLLDDYATRSGYVITPVVVWGGADVELRPSPDEVLAAYRIGLHELCREDSPRFVEIPESDRPVVQVPLSGDLIHAPTGALLVQFRWVGLEGLTGDACRVNHMEQPVFAWG
jgi:8-oxo-dGTP pyrophosphatase MutT (NUDIX family)